MPFINTIISNNIDNNSVIEFEFSTNIITFNNGNEIRDQILNAPKVKYKINYSNLRQKDAQTIISFFYQCRGMMNSFRIRNWLNNQLNKEILYTESGSKLQQIQIIKKYVYNGYEYSKKITKPVIGSVNVFIDNNELAKEFYTIDDLRGIITLKDPLKNEEVISISCIYDDEVRFNSDKISVENDENGLFSINNLELIEVL